MHGKIGLYCAIYDVIAIVNNSGKVVHSKNRVVTTLCFLFLHGYRLLFMNIL